MRIIAGSKRGMKLFSPPTQSPPTQRLVRRAGPPAQRVRRAGPPAQRVRRAGPPTQRLVRRAGPKGELSRPITDRVKESLFSVLYKYDLPAGKMVADLFCGVGSLGLEALSRGAEFVTFVEKDPKIIAILKKNIEKARFTRESKIIRANAFKIGAAVDEQKYDLIFVDPPYSTTQETAEGSPLSELLMLLGEQSASDGIVVVRTDRRTELLEQYGQLRTIERRRWGTMAVTILQKKL